MSRSNFPDDTPRQETRASAEELRQLTQGQRRTNLIWEVTQSLIAMVITGAIVFAVFGGKDVTALGPAFTLVIALYFVRTNHQKVGSGPDQR